MSKKVVWLIGAVIVTLAAVTLASRLIENGELFAYLYQHKRAQLADLPSLAAPAPGNLAIRNVNLIPMTEERVIPSQTVLIRDGLIQAIGDTATLEIPESYRVIEAEHRFLMPGLADMHVHMGNSAFNHRLFIINGVTSVREMSGSREVLDWIDAIAAGAILAPDIYTATPILRGRGNGAQESSIRLENAAQARSEVARLYRDGYRIVKPYTYLSAQVYNALMAAAKGLGMTVVGHISYAVGLRGALAAGQDEAAHIHSFHQEFFTGFDPEQVFQEYPIDRSRLLPLAASVSRAKMRVTTTLLVNQVMLDAKDMEAFLDRPMQAYEAAWASYLMRSPKFRLNKMWSREYLQRHYLPWLYALTKTLHDESVVLVLGTDSGVTGLVHGFSVHAELALLVNAGLSPYEALLTATRNAAIAVQEEERWGTLEQGKRANLLLLAENPLLDIGDINPDNILAVVKSGYWIGRERLEELRSQTKALLH